MWVLAADLDWEAAEEAVRDLDALTTTLALGFLREFLDPGTFCSERVRFAVGASTLWVLPNEGDHGVLISVAVRLLDVAEILPVLGVRDWGPRSERKIELRRRTAAEYRERYGDGSGVLRALPDGVRSSRWADGARSPDHVDVVGAQLLVFADQCHLLDARLGDQEAIERVTVVPRQVLN